METPFYVEENFYDTIEDYLIDKEWGEEEIKAFPEDWTVEIGIPSLEPVCQINIDDFIDNYVVDQLCEENLPEEPDYTIERIKKAVKENVDFTKINEAMPKLWYMNNKAKDGFLTKRDLLSIF
jgi:hypothetical protein